MKVLPTCRLVAVKSSFVWLTMSATIAILSTAPNHSLSANTNKAKLFTKFSLWWELLPWPAPGRESGTAYVMGCAKELGLFLWERMLKLGATKSFLCFWKLVSFALHYCWLSHEFLWMLLFRSAWWWLYFIRHVPI